MTKKTYKNWSREELLAEMRQLQKRKKYGLVWESKSENVVEQCKHELPVLEEAKERKIIADSDTSSNLLVEGDNYHALSVLNYTHKAKIDVIYIDPPYNTGENGFKFNDKYVDKEDGFRHSKWLSFMEKRLRLARNLLNRTGVIIIHIDENEQENLYALLSEIFGEQNDLGTIVWNKKNPKGDSKGVSIMHESILCFAKNKDAFLSLKNVLQSPKPNAEAILKKAKSLFRKQGKTAIPDEVKDVIKPFNYSKEALEDFKVTHSLELLNKEFQNWLSKQDFSGGEKAYKYIDSNGDVYRGVSMAWPNKSKAPDEYFEPLIHPVTKKACPIPSRGWRYPRKTMQDLLSKEQILFGNDENKQPERKYFLKDNLLQNTPSIFSDASSDDAFFNDAGLHFPYPKPVVVSKYLLSAIHPNPKIICDFMAGSGTTGHAVLELLDDGYWKNQVNFILCTNDENGICTEICHPRLNLVMNGFVGKVSKKKYKRIGGNLRYFRTNFVPSDPTDHNKCLLTQKATEMLCIKENTFDEVENNKKFKIFRHKNRYTGIIFDHLAIPAFKKVLAKTEGKFSVYIFSLGDDTFDEEFEDAKSKVKLSPIPEVILRVYRRIFK